MHKLAQKSIIHTKSSSGTETKQAKVATKDMATKQVKVATKDTATKQVKVATKDTVRTNIKGLTHSTDIIRIIEDRMVDTKEDIADMATTRVKVRDNSSNKKLTHTCKRHQF